jgi:hypothetical protein
MPKGTVKSRPWITSWVNAPSNPPPGGFQGWLALSLSAAASSVAGMEAASRRAHRSAILLKLPRALRSPTTNCGIEYRNGIVMWATTSRTRHPAHSVCASHISADKPVSTAASSWRSAAIASLISVSVIADLLVAR